MMKLPRPRGFAALLTTLVVLLFATPFFASLPIGPVLVDLALGAVLLCGAWVMGAKRRRRLYVYLAAAVTVMALRFAGQATGETAYPVAGLSAAVLFCGTASLLVLLSVARRTRVDADAIFGAICVYLFVGVTFALAYAALESLVPGSFASGGQPVSSGAATSTSVTEFVYFSIVTLSTLGYGDFVPVSQQARMLAAFEAVLGQVYLTVLVARLVGLHIAHERSADPTSPTSAQTRS